MKKFRTSRRVEFRDTDAAGIMHFSVYFTTMEEMEHEFLRHVGLSVVHETPGGTISWPRVSANCNYLRPVKFEKSIDVEVSITRLGEKSITYLFQLSSEGNPIAEGTMTVVCCLIQRHMEHLPTLKSVPIPQDIIDKVTPYVAANDS